jgi:hypothetical protein
MHSKSAIPEDERSGANVPDHTGFSHLLPMGETRPWDKVEGWFYGNLETDHRGTISMFRSDGGPALKVPEDR